MEMERLLKKYKTKTLETEDKKKDFAQNVERIFFK